ncbi:transglutaminase domain-containing protein [uncultured Roseobacter sp.]|uniref:transglutaminase domain-containing protein n=1 Tax=uncultured Roseobacter sp. TaxID=114847 RepID=UPI002603407F|nr:transglutaminase domain-containing protein [uncultured Roseobacter sp.]
MHQQNASQFYLRHGEWSDPKECVRSFDVVPGVVSAVTSTVQGILLHDYFGAHLYAEPPGEIAQASRATLPVSERLTSVHAFGKKPLTQARHTSSRSIGTCRDYALLTCSLLRHHGIAARVRCGFARYFHPPTYEDHWICEYQDAATKEWKMADAQLDEEHRKHLSITFDVNDLPKEQFLYPWHVWEQFGHDFPRLEDFGQGDAKGLWFVRINLARDFLALTKQEVSDWDSWRDQTDADKKAVREAIAQCDELAAAGKLLDTAETFDLDALDGLIASLQTPHWRS